MRMKSYDDLVDSFIWKKVRPTYEQVHALRLVSQSSCRDYVTNRWGDEIGKRGITIRSNKLWNAVCGSLRALPSETIEGSLWRVTYNISQAIANDEIEGWSSKFDIPVYRILDSYETYSLLGWVIADNESDAKMTARVILGPRAHSPTMRVLREGVSTWSEVKNKNKKHADDIRKLVERAKEIQRLKLIELEALECQVSFLEIGATFEPKVEFSHSE